MRREEFLITKYTKYAKVLTLREAREEFLASNLRKLNTNGEREGDCFPKGDLLKKTPPLRPPSEWCKRRRNR